MSVFKNPQCKSNSAHDRMISLRLLLVREILFEVGQFMQESHILLFAFLLVKLLYPDKFFNTGEWSLFVTPLKLRDKLEPANPAYYPPWLPDEKQPDIEILKKYCPYLIKSNNIHDSTWNDWFLHDTPETSFPVSSKLTKLQQLLFIQSLRPDRFIEAIANFCCFELSIQSLVQSQSLKDFYNSRSGYRTFLLITLPGTDPTLELEQLASEAIGDDR